MLLLGLVHAATIMLQIMSEEELKPAVAERWKKLSHIPAVRRGLEALKSLKSDFKYHSCDHTLDVVHEALLFSLQDRLDDRKIELLIIAAVYHDSGFLIDSNDNEQIGAALAARAMVDSYTVEEIEEVRVAILDTVIVREGNSTKQKPVSQLGRYLCDADTSNLGRADFLDKAELVRLEKNILAPKFCKMLPDFLAVHEWHTPAAKLFRTAGKLLNIARL